MNSQEIIKKEMDPAGDEYESHVYIKEEEDLMHLELKQELEPCSDISLASNSQNILSAYPNINRNNFHCHKISCNYSTVNEMDLKKHVCSSSKNRSVLRRKHISRRQYQCSQCGRKFLRKQLLDDHQKSHLTVKYEMDASEDYSMDVKIEEHPVQVEIKQEIEPHSNLLLTDNSQMGASEDYSMDVKIEEHPVQVESKLEIEPHSNLSLKYNSQIGASEDYSMDVKIEEHPVQVEIKQEIEPHSNLSLKDNSQMGASEDYSMDMKIEEHPVQVELKQEIEPHSDLLLPDNSQCISTDYTEISRNKFHCYKIDCDYSTGSEFDLSVHQQNHLAHKFHCYKIDCDYSTGSELDLSVHQQKHRGHVKYPCSHCYMFYFRKCDLTKHQKTGECYPLFK
ncbi:unnamed protein product [Meganyctiphanes norvegica]|uniref:C2H2-type domain-containing protein n=1 Tax=Meganyctiphanes norvegica TaxID=48144 RepID=A0AAV2S7T7_MEGNR